MNPSFRHLAATLAVAGLCALTQTSCKENTIIKADAAPLVDNINTFQVPDTLTMIAQTYYDDSAVTSLTFTGVPAIHGVGTANDPFFGRTNASIYMQVLPTTNSFNLPAGSTYDSSAIVLPFTNFSWGDTTSATATQQFQVYRIGSGMSIDSTYYTFTSKPLPEALSDVTTLNIRNLRDSVTIGNTKVAPHMHIKLNSVWDALLTSNLGGSNFADKASFLNWLNGIAVVPADSTQAGKAIPYFLLNGANDYARAAIAIYYDINNDDSVRTAFFNFSPQETAHFNKISRNLTGAAAQAIINSYNPNKTVSDDLVLLQNEPGAAIDVKFPFIKNLPNTIINKAELVISKKIVDPLTDVVFFEPARIFPVGIDSLGRPYTLLDREPVSSAEPLTFLGGNRQLVVENNVTYVRYIINVPREVQRTITEQRSALHLRIGGTQTFPAAYRLIAGGKNTDNNYSIKLNIIYSLL